MRALLALVSATSLAVVGGVWVHPVWEGGASVRAAIPRLTSGDGAQTSQESLAPVSRAPGRTPVHLPQQEDDPRDRDAINDVIGSGGGGAGRSFTWRFRRSRTTTVSGCGFRARPSAAETRDGAPDRPLETVHGGSFPASWLTSVQGSDGAWTRERPPRWCFCEGRFACDRPDYQLGRVGTTALALLALLGDGNTTRNGPHRNAVVRGVKWLRKHQHPRTGQFADGIVSSTDLEHGLATLAFAELYRTTRSPLLRKTLQLGLHAFGEEGTRDVFTTGWRVLAVLSAEEAGIGGERGAFDRGALALFEATTDPLTGATLESDTLTAMTLLCRIRLGQTTGERPLLEAGAHWLAEHPPTWNPARFRCDRWKWLLGSLALRRLDGAARSSWRRALTAAFTRALGRTPEYGDILSREPPPVAGASSAALWSLSLQGYLRIEGGGLAR